MKESTMESTMEMDKFLDEINSFECSEEEWGWATPYDKAYDHLTRQGYHDEDASAILWMVKDGDYDVLGCVRHDERRFVVELDSYGDWALTPWGEWWGLPSDLGDGWGLLREILSQDRDEAERCPIAVASALRLVWPGEDRQAALDYIKRAEDRDG